MSSEQVRKQLIGAELAFEKMKADSRERYKEQAAQEDAIKLFKAAIILEEKLLAEDTWLLKLHGEHVYLYSMPDAFPKLRILLFDGYCHHTAFSLTPSVNIRYDDGELTIGVEDSKALDFLKNEGVKVNIGYMEGGIAKLKERLEFLEGLKLMFKDMEDS